MPITRGHKWRVITDAVHKWPYPLQNAVTGDSTDTLRHRVSFTGSTLGEMDATLYAIKHDSDMRHTVVEQIAAGLVDRAGLSGNAQAEEGNTVREFVSREADWLLSTSNRINRGLTSSVETVNRSIGADSDPTHTIDPEGILSPVDALLATLAVQDAILFFILLTFDTDNEMTTRSQTASRAGYYDNPDAHYGEFRHYEDDEVPLVPHFEPRVPTHTQKRANEATAAADAKAQTKKRKGRGQSLVATMGGGGAAGQPKRLL